MNICNLYNQFIEMKDGMKNTVNQFLSINENSKIEVEYENSL